MPEENKAVVSDGQAEKCQRWRKIAIQQLGYVLNLTLTFSIAALGYCFALLRDEDFVLEYPAGRAMSFAMVALALSVILGFACAVVRLVDFRGSARRACDHPLKPPKEAMRDLDDLVWRLFYLQLWGFGLGALALGVTLLLAYGYKLA